MLIFIQEIGLQLFLWLLQLVDGLMEIFSAISGVATVNYHGQQVNIIEFIVGDSTIGAVFLVHLYNGGGIDMYLHDCGACQEHDRQQQECIDHRREVFSCAFGDYGDARRRDTRYPHCKFVFTAFGTDIPSEQHDETIHGNFQCLRRRMAERVFRVEYRRNFAYGQPNTRRV